MISMIGLFYPSFHLNPRNPPIKALIFSLLIIFEPLLALGYHKAMETRSKPKETHFFMLNLVVEKGANKDHDGSRSSITQPTTSTPTGFVKKRSGLDFGFFFFIYNRHPFSFSFSFYLIVVTLTSSTCASLNLAIIEHRSIFIAVHPYHFAIITTPFHLF